MNQLLLPPPSHNRLRGIYALLWVLAFGTQMAYSQTDWELVKSSDGIDVYHRYQDSNRVPELNITLTVRSTLAGAVEVINDASRFPEWIYNCEEGRVLETFSPGHFMYYSRTDFPLWLDDREFVLVASTHQDPDNLQVYLDAEARPDYLPLEKGRVRVQTSFSRWTLLPIGGGEVRVSYYLHADVEGAIPDWMTRAAINVGPVQSLKRFIARVESPPYQRMTLPYIQEPSDVSHLDGAKEDQVGQNK